MTHTDNLIVGGAAAFNVVAQVLPDGASAAKWIEVIGKLSATAVLAVACYVLWRQLQREQADNIKLRGEHIESLKTVIESNTKAFERVSSALERMR